MTEICIYRKDKDIVKYMISGHTGFDEAGQDIVCAAVSTLGISTINGLTEVNKISVGCEIRDGYLECVLPENLSEEERKNSNILLETLFLSLKNLEEQYGKYITITELEV